MKQNVPKWIGVKWIRTATISWNVGTIAVVWILRRSVHPMSLILLAVVGILGIILSFRSLFRTWIKLGGFLHECISALIFSTCYLFIVPFFAFPIKAAAFVKRICFGPPTTFWKPKQRANFDQAFFERMG